MVTILGAHRLEGSPQLERSKKICFIKNNMGGGGGGQSNILSGSSQFGAMPLFATMTHSTGTQSTRRGF